MLIGREQIFIRSFFVGNLIPECLFLGVMKLLIFLLLL